MTRWEIIRWWEIRRIPYNAALFVIGIASIMGMDLLMEKVLPPGDDAVEPIGLFFGIAAYALMANLCYTSGWILELGIKKAGEAQARLLARKLFLWGFLASCVLTSAPFWYGVAFFLLQRKGPHG
jgi:hypothetical protein